MVQIKVIIKNELLQDAFFNKNIKPIINISLQDFFQKANLKKKHNLLIQFDCSYNGNKIINKVKDIQQNPENLIESNIKKIDVLKYHRAKRKVKKYSSSEKYAWNILKQYIDDLKEQNCQKLFILFTLKVIFPDLTTKLCNIPFVILLS